MPLLCRATQQPTCHTAAETWRHKAREVQSCIYSARLSRVSVGLHTRAHTCTPSVRPGCRATGCAQRLARPSRERHGRPGPTFRVAYKQVATGSKDTPVAYCNTAFMSNTVIQQAPLGPRVVLRCSHRRPLLRSRKHHQRLPSQASHSCTNMYRYIMQNAPLCPQLVRHYALLNDTNRNDKLCRWAADPSAVTQLRGGL